MATPAISVTTGGESFVMANSSSLALAKKPLIQQHKMLATAEDHARAVRFMSQRFPGNTRSGPFTYKEATRVLTQVVRGNITDATPSLVQALVQKDTDVCFERRRSSNFLKVVAGKNQQPIRSNLFEEAVRNCSDEIVRVLAFQADDIALNQALPIAIRANTLEKTLTLLARSANATPLRKEFIETVEIGSVSLVDTLLGSRPLNRACQDCRDRGLVRASASGHTTKARTLMAKGASAIFEDAAAFKTAIHTGREDIAGPY